MRAYDLLTSVAVADALGYPLEFKSNPTSSDLMEAVLNPEGLTCSDDTQMSLFLCEALNDWHLKQEDDFRVSVTSAYLRWYRTQVGSRYSDDTGLMAFPALYAQEAPGSTCIGSMRTIRGGGVPHNNSKGNGTLMRCSPIALHVVQRCNASVDVASLLAGIDAEVTHHHPYAAFCSKYFCVLLTICMSGVGLHTAIVETTKYMLEDDFSRREVVKLISSALHHSKYRDMRRSLVGWVAEEALALAIGAVAHSRTYLEVVSMATTFAGDSDTVAAIAGALAASIGMVPDSDMVESLNLLAPIKYASELPVWTE